MNPPIFRSTRISIAYLLRYALALSLVLPLVPRTSTESCFAEENYQAIFRNETEVTSSKLEGWFPREEPSLEDKVLFEAENPIRLLRNIALIRSPVKPPYIALTNGDVLPGSIVKFDPGPSWLDSPRFIVSPAHPLQTAKANQLRVRANCVQRVIFSHIHGGELTPGTLVLRDGRRSQLRSLRWTSRGISALTSSGTVTARFEEIAQIDVPNADPVATLVRDGDRAHGLIARMETTGGAILTYQRRSSTSVTVDHRMLASLNRRGIDLGDVVDRGWNLKRRQRISLFSLFSSRRRPSTERRYHGVRPAWSFERIVVPDQEIVLRGYRDASEIPLSLLPAKVLAQKSLVAPTSRWRRNQSMQNNVLVSGNVRADLGIATRSHSEIAFQLPLGALEFTGWVGMDRAMGSGGCVRCKIYLGNAYGEPVSGEPVWSSAFIRGNEPPTRIEPIDVSKAAQLILVTEFGHDDRPRGADPLDIRDEVDWLLPSIKVDPDIFYASD